MDAYADALGVTDAPPTKKAVVPAQVLDGLRLVESGGNQYAVNKDTGAMGPYQFMPATVAMLHKQGIKFNPFDEEQARGAAEAYLGQLIERNGGDVRKALGQYGGFVTKDPSAYVDKVMAKAGTATPSAAAQADPYGDALGIGRPAQPITAARSGSPQITPISPASMLTADPATKAPETSLRPVLGHMVTGIGANIVGGYRGLSTLLSGGTVDDAANNVRDYVAKHTYTPEAGTQGAKAVESFQSPANPLNYPAQVGDYLGEKVTDVTGSPALGAAVNTAVNAAPLVFGMRGKPGSAPVEVGPGKPGTGIYRPLGGQPSMQIPAPGESAPIVPQAVPRQAAPVAANTPAPGEVRVAPPVPTTPEAVQTVAQKAPSSLFPETPTISPAGKFSAAEQLDRAKVLESVGIDPTQLRKSAISGDPIAGSTDFQTSKLDSAAGRTMKAIIDGERQALINHADTLVKQTGGTHGVDQSTLYARGNTIVAPLDGLKQWFDNRIGELYRAADERAQGVPTQLDTFKSVLNDASNLTNSDRVHLQSSVNAYAKKLGVASDEGTLAGSAQQAETIRKYLNENWSPQNSKFVGALKDALDEDVTKAAGSDIYAEARKVRALRGSTLDNPNGIAKLMDSSGPEGINRSVPVEKISDSLTGMPVDQFSHVVRTLKEAPVELQPQAQAALAEVKAQFANKVQAVGSSQAGQWNAKGVTKYLQDNAARMAQVFTPEEIAQFRNLNDAGHIVAKDQSYPGAAVQAHNLITQGTMHALPTAGAALGGALGGPVGAAVGAAGGRMAAGAVDNAVTLRAVKKRTTKLSDLLGAGK